MWFKTASGCNSLSWNDIKIPIFHCMTKMVMRVEIVKLLPVFKIFFIMPGEHDQAKTNEV